MIAWIKAWWKRRKSIVVRRTTFDPPITPKPGKYEGQYALFVSTTKKIYHLGANDENIDAYFERWAAREKDTYGDTVLDVWKVKILKHHEAVLGPPEDRRW